MVLILEERVLRKALKIATREVACSTREGSIAWSGVAMEAAAEPGMVPVQGE